MASISKAYPEIHRAEIAAKVIVPIGIIATIASIITLGLTISGKIPPTVPGACFATTVAISIVLLAVIKYQIKKAEHYIVNLHELYKNDDVHFLLVRPLLNKLLPIKA